MATLTKEIIEAAINGFEAQKQHIDAQLAELRAMLSPSSSGSAPAPQATGRKKRGMSTAGRKAIAEAQPLWKASPSGRKQQGNRNGSSARPVERQSSRP
jgi:hypothetical protein